MALAVGVPVAAVTSALIGTFIAGSALHGFDEGGLLAGQVLRGGVSGAVRLSPADRPGVGGLGRRGSTLGPIGVPAGGPSDR